MYQTVTSTEKLRFTYFNNTWKDIQKQKRYKTMLRKNNYTT